MVLVAHDGARVDLLTRGQSGWTMTSFGAGDIVRLDAIGCTLAVDDVYAAAENA